MAPATLDKSFAVNPFGKQVHIDRRPESVEEVEMPTLDETVEMCVDQYERIKHCPIYKLLVVPSYMKINILTPIQIEMVLNKIINQFDYKYESYDSLGFYMNRLIRESFASGHNDFTLSTCDVGINILARESTGNSGININLEVIGTLGGGTANDARSINMELYGDVAGNVGAGSHFCNYTVHGNVGGKIGDGSEYCNFRILDRQVYDKTIKEIKAKSCMIQLIDNNKHILEEVRV